MVHQQIQNGAISGGPLTPEGTLPGTNPSARIPQPTFGHTFASSHGLTTLLPTSSPESGHTSPFLPYSKPLSLFTDHGASFRTNRARSASNRSGGAGSNYSADFEDADPIPPMPGLSKFSPAELLRHGSGESPGAAGLGSGGNGTPFQANANMGTPRRESPGQGIW